MIIVYIVSIYTLLNFIKNNTEDTFKITSHELIEILKDNGITATITGREKTPFSIWRKIQNKKILLKMNYGTWLII